MFSLLSEDVFTASGLDQHRLAIADEPRVRRASELAFAVAALVYPAWHFVFISVMPAARDSLIERIGLAAAVIATMAGFRFKSLRQHIPAMEQVLVFVVTAHYLSVVWRNDMALPYMVGLYVVFTSFSIILTRMVVVLAYCGSCLTAVVVMAAFLAHPAALVLEYVLGIATVFTAMLVGTHRTSAIRRAAMARIFQGQQLLKQVIETIPDPMFVRDADRELLLTNEAGRRFESATGFDLVAVSTQEELALSGGRTLEADAEVKTSFGRLSMAVKTAVARVPDGPLMLVTIMRDVTDRRALEESLRRKVQELEEARQRVRQLQGMLPICMHCSRIRVDDGQWQKLEAYVSNNSAASFTHTLCKSCLEENYPVQEPQ